MGYLLMFCRHYNDRLFSFTFISEKDAKLDFFPPMKSTYNAYEQVPVCKWNRPWMNVEPLLKPSVVTTLTAHYFGSHTVKIDCSFDKAPLKSSVKGSLSYKG